MAPSTPFHAPRSRPWRPEPLCKGSIGEYVHRDRPRSGARDARRLRRLPRRTACVPETRAALSDLELIAAVVRRDERAASTLYDRYSPVMFGLALRITGETADAEEVVIDAFGQVWRDAERYDGTRASVAGWLTTIVRTRALDLMRSRARRTRMGDAVTAAGEPVAMGTERPDPFTDTMEHERARHVSAALVDLPSAQREAIELAFFDGLTHQEVAERLAEPLGTIKTRIRLGMQKLRDVLRHFAPDRRS